MLLSADSPKKKTGGAYRLAVRVCLAALEGRVSAEKARTTFIAAVQEVGMSTREER